MTGLCFQVQKIRHKNIDIIDMRKFGLRETSTIKKKDSL